MTFPFVRSAYPLDMPSRTSMASLGEPENARDRLRCRLAWAKTHLQNPEHKANCQWLIAKCFLTLKASAREAASVGKREMRSSAVGRHTSLCCCKRSAWVISFDLEFSSAVKAIIRRGC